MSKILKTVCQLRFLWASVLISGGETMFNPLFLHKCVNVKALIHIGRLILKEDAGIENVRNSRCVVHSGLMVCNGCYGTVLLVTHLNS